MRKRSGSWGRVAAATRSSVCQGVSTNKEQQKKCKMIHLHYVLSKNKKKNKKVEGWRVGAGRGENENRVNRFF